jgi:hypothetical protein
MIRTGIREVFSRTRWRTPSRTKKQEKLPACLHNSRVRVRNASLKRSSCSDGPKARSNVRTQLITSDREFREFRRKPTIISGWPFVIAAGYPSNSVVEGSANENGVTSSSAAGRDALALPDVIAIDYGS